MLVDNMRIIISMMSQLSYESPVVNERKAFGFLCYAMLYSCGIF